MHFLTVKNAYPPEPPPHPPGASGVTQIGQIKKFINKARNGPVPPLGQLLLHMIQQFICTDFYLGYKYVK